MRKSNDYEVCKTLSDQVYEVISSGKYSVAWKMSEQTKGKKQDT